MAIENEELMHKWSQKHLRMGTARMKEYKETEEEGQQKIVKMEKSKLGMK